MNNLRGLGAIQNTAGSRLLSMGRHLHTTSIRTRQKEESARMYFTFGGLGILTLFGMWYTVSFHLLCSTGAATDVKHTVIELRNPNEWPLSEA